MTPIAISSGAISNIIAGLALLVAGIALWRQASVDRRMTALELERREEEKADRQELIADRRSANLSIRFVKYRNRMGHNFIITNNGPSEARNVDFTASSPLHRNWKDDVTNRTLLPIPTLGPGDSLPIAAREGYSAAPPFEMALAWEDGREGTQHAVRTVTIELLQG